MSSLISIHEEERIAQVNKGGAFRAFGHLSSLTVSCYEETGHVATSTFTC